MVGEDTRPLRVLLASVFTRLPETKRHSADKSIQMKNIFCAFLLAVPIIITACRTTSKSMDMAMQKELHHKWMLKTIDSVEDILVQKSKAYIDLSCTGQASAKAGCNSLGFGIKLPGGNKIGFTQGLSTMMYCAEFMPAENGLVAALKKVASYIIEAHKISFKDKDSKVLITGVAEDWD